MKQKIDNQSVFKHTKGGRESSCLRQIALMLKTSQISLNEHMRVIFLRDTYLPLVLTTDLWDT